MKVPATDSEFHDYPQGEDVAGAQMYPAISAFSLLIHAPPRDPMPELKTKDLTRCAAILADAVGEVDGRVLKTVDTAFGRADVVVDDQAADVDLHGGPTVHVRFSDPDYNP